MLRTTSSGRLRVISTSFSRAREASKCVPAAYSACSATRAAFFSFTAEVVADMSGRLSAVWGAARVGVERVSALAGPPEPGSAVHRGAHWAGRVAMNADLAPSHG